MRKKYGAYMTVEACMVMPVVLMVYLFLIRYAVWAYDRCMLEYDVATVLLRSAITKEPEITYQREQNVWDKDKYIWFHSQEMVMTKGAFTLTMEGRAEGGNMGDVMISYEMWNIEPELWLRGKRKLEQEQNGSESEER